jgi:hypothetical protein
MTTQCMVCGVDFEVDNDIFLTEEDPLDENNEQICNDCCELIREYWHYLHLN